jgi:hypothetical protein
VADERQISRTRQRSSLKEGVVAKAIFPLDRRQLLASIAAAASAPGIAPHLQRVNADAVKTVSAAPDVPALNVSAGMARRLQEIARRNAIRREVGLPLLSPIKELRRMKQVELLEEFARFEAAHHRTVLQGVLKRRRDEEGDPNWRPGWMEGVAIQSRIRGTLLERFHAVLR